ncbi:MAG TPA: SBBP repeat-containing protein [Roseiflexaceae bacterium]|nr:SBBP repeat-containing protein [Roseiflexaceae bacterium]
MKTILKLALLPTLLAILALSRSAEPIAAQTTTGVKYGTFLGGASDDAANAVATDAQGNIYIAGSTYSKPFPGTSGQMPYTDAFVTKLDPTGTQVLYSIAIGGSNDEEALAMAVDPQGNVWVTGFTESNNLPLISPIRTTFDNNRDTFLTKIDANGNPVLQTYMGEDGSDQANAIALDAQGNAYLAGEKSWDYGPAIFVRKIKADASAQVYQAFFGQAARGFDRGSRGYGLAVDAQGNAYVAGKTNTGAVDTGGFQNQCVGYQNEIDDCPSDDGFILVLNAAGNAIIGGTILGGLANDSATSVALGPDGSVFVAGTTYSDDFPTKNAWQNERKGLSTFSDGFLVKLAPLAGSLTYGTYYGGTASDELLALDVDQNGAAYLTGQTASPDLPVPGAFQPAIDGICITGSIERLCYDALVARFDGAGTLAWASYYGGTDDDLGRGIAVGSSGDMYVAGRAASLTLPTTDNALQPRRRALDDAFVARIGTDTGTQAKYRIALPVVMRP